MRHVETVLPSARLCETVFPRDRVEATGEASVAILGLEEHGLFIEEASVTLASCGELFGILVLAEKFCCVGYRCVSEPISLRFGYRLVRVGGRNVPLLDV